MFFPSSGKNSLWTMTSHIEEQDQKPDMLFLDRPHMSVFLTSNLHDNYFSTRCFHQHVWCLAWPSDPYLTTLQSQMCCGVLNDWRERSRISNRTVNTNSIFLNNIMWQRNFITVYSCRHVHQMFYHCTTGYPVPTFFCCCLEKGLHTEGCTWWPGASCATHF